MVLQITEFCVGEWMWGWETGDLTPQSLNNLFEPSSSVKWELGKRCLPRRYLHLNLHILWGQFFIVWRPGNSQGQILPLFSTVQSFKILEAGMSPTLGQLHDHSWDFSLSRKWHGWDGDWPGDWSEWWPHQQHSEEAGPVVAARSWIWLASLQNSLGFCQFL